MRRLILRLVTGRCTTGNRSNQKNQWTPGMSRYHNILKAEVTFA